MTVTFPASNSCEGGSQGTGVTQANSGGGSGTAFDNVTVTSNGTLIYDGTHPANGTLGYQCTRPTDAHFGAFWRWEFADISEFWGRCYIYLPSGTFPTTSPVRVCLVASSTGTRRAELNFNSSRQLRVVNSANVAQESSTALAADTLYRIEWRFFFSGTAATGRMETSYYLGNDVSAVQTLRNGVDVDTGGVAGRCEFGGTSVAVSDGYVWWADEFAISSTGAIGPAGAVAQTVRPDADVLTTGWSTAPLFSKLNDQSDASVVTATLA